jgi:hypothetical protein
VYAVRFFHRWCSWGAARLPDANCGKQKHDAQKLASNDPPGY